MAIFRLVQVALHALGLSLVQVDTALGQYEQQDGGAHKARSKLCFSKVHAQVWLWIHSIMVGAMRSCEWGFSLC